MISICLTTRGRPEAFLEMCESALLNADYPEDIEFVSYHDKDDESHYKYIGNHTEIIGKTKTISEMMNATHKFARGEILMFIADDFIFMTPSWDTMVCKEFDKEKIQLVCPYNTDWDRWGFGVIGFVHREWVKTLGYFIPTFLGECPDRWLNDLAVAIDRRKVLQDCIVTHKNIKDDVHRNKKRIALKNKWTKKYWDVEMRQQREKDINKLCAILQKNT